MVLRLLEERVDPVLRAVVVGHVVVEEQLPEHEPAADVGEGAEGEDAVRRLDELPDLGALVDDRLDDRADRLVDERDPELVGVSAAIAELLLLSPGPPRDLRRGDDQQDGKELPEHVFRQRFGDLRRRRRRRRSTRRR